MRTRVIYEHSHSIFETTCYEMDTQIVISLKLYILIIYAVKYIYRGGCFVICCSVNIHNLDVLDKLINLTTNRAVFGVLLKNPIFMLRHFFG